MSAPNLEKEILGRVLHQPKFLVHCRETDFCLDKNRQIFLKAAQVFRADGFLDLSRLYTSLDESAQSGAASYLASLMDGIQKVNEPVFLSLLKKLRMDRNFQRFAAEVEKQKQAKAKGLEIETGHLQELLEQIKISGAGQDNEVGNFIGSLEDFLAVDIPIEEEFCSQLLFRGALVEVGGTKGSHKSFFMNSLSLHLAAGRSPFLSFAVPKPCRVLLIQQEISVGQHRARIERMTRAGRFETGGRLFTYTTTGHQRKLENPEDLGQIKKWISECKPDVLCLDPLSSFEQGEENNSRDRKRTVSILNELKATYGLGLCVSHHFSSKVSPDDPLAPKEAGGWFRGHSAFPDAADTLICLHRLPGQRENPNLPLSYEDYNLVEIQTRNGKWPGRFAIEFDESSFLMKCSSVWDDLKKKIIPGEIADFVDERGGEVLFKDIIDHFKDKADRDTIRRAIKIEARAGVLEEDRLPGQGRPLIVRRLNTQDP